MSAVRFARAAVRDVERIDTWWRANRPAASDLFHDEIHEVVGLLAEVPMLGTPYPAPTRSPTRRVFLPESQVHVYYRVDLAGDVVTILRVWGARRGRGPALR